MRRYTDAEMAKKDAVKITRAAIRVKHSIAADHELNDVLPDLEERIDSAILGGARLEISAADLYGAVIDGKDIENAGN